MKKLIVLLSFTSLVCLVTAQQGSNIPPNAKIQMVTPVLKVDQTPAKVNPVIEPKAQTANVPPQKAAATCNHDGKACTKDGKAGCGKSASGACSHGTEQKGQ